LITGHERSPKDLRAALPQIMTRTQPRYGLEFQHMSAHNAYVHKPTLKKGAVAMVFDLHIHIDDRSPESDALESIVSRDRVSPEEAILRMLREMGRPSPAQEMIGALADPASIAILDEVVSEAYRMRSLDQPRSTAN